MQVSRSGGEIEREVGSVECELVDGVWEQDRDSLSSSKGSKKTTAKKTIVKKAPPK